MAVSHGAPDSGAAADPQPARARALWLAARPRTLPVAVAPVCVGTALAAAQGPLHGGLALTALAGALWLQIGANLANDVYDFERGADRDDRLGPPRASQRGWLSPSQVRGAMVVAFALASGCGLYLAMATGWPIIAIGLASLAAAWAYTGGKHPYGYAGWGELAVFAFFGLAAVCGSYWVQVQAIPPAVLAAAIPPGCLAAAILAVNNLRDRVGDAAAGKRTLAVRLGARAARIEYAALLAVAYAVPALTAATGLAPLAALAPLATAPWALVLVRRVQRESGPPLNAVLAATALLELAYCLLYAAGLGSGPGQLEELLPPWPL